MSYAHVSIVFKKNMNSISGVINFDDKRYREYVHIP